MTTTEALDPRTELANRIVSFAIDEAQRAMDIAEKSRDILKLLPEDLIYTANCNSGWLQFSGCSREQTEEILRTLHAGKWNKKVSSKGSDMIDYEGTVNGVRVIIYAAPPPGSCRIVEEVEEVPAHTITKRRMICAKSVAATENNE